MGGFGSGLLSNGRPGWRPHIEGALILDIARIHAAVELRPRFRVDLELKWNKSRKPIVMPMQIATAADRGSLRLRYCWRGEPTSCEIALETTRPTYGGLRWWMLCPYTGRRARKLYAWPSIRYFCHREAINPLPTYASQRLSGMNLIIHQRWNLRRRMGDRISNLCEPPVKPKWMRWHTFERYLQRDSELEAREHRWLDNDSAL